MGHKAGKGISSLIELSETEIERIEKDIEEERKQIKIEYENKHIRDLIIIEKEAELSNKTIGEIIREKKEEINNDNIRIIEKEIKERTERFYNKLYAKKGKK